MKKSVRIILASALIITMCLCLCGCQQLDDLRAQHGVWTNKNSTESITIDGTEYIQLTGENLMNLRYHNMRSTPVYITKEDVPVLLASVFNDGQFSMTEDKNFIFNSESAEYEYSSISFISVSSYSYAGYADVVYAKKDIYDTISNMLDGEINYTKYGYTYYQYNEEEGTDEVKEYTLTNHEVDTINEVLTVTKPELVDEPPFTANYITSIDKISDNEWFAEYCFEIYKDDVKDTYYLVDFNSIDIKLWVVPKEYNATFDNITKCAMLEYEYWESISE